MTEIKRCHKCGSPLSVSGPDGLGLSCSARCDSAANLKHVIRDSHSVVARIFERNLGAKVIRKDMV